MCLCYESAPCGVTGQKSDACILVSSANQKKKNVILDFIHEAHVSLQVGLGNLINSCQQLSGLFFFGDTT